MTVARVKEKLMTHVGSNVSTMRLSLKDWDGALVAPMSDDAKMLGYFSPEDGWTIHIDDTDAHSASAGGWLEDVSKVKKYEMSDEKYNARENTYRQWKNEQLAKDPTDAPCSNLIFAAAMAGSQASTIVLSPTAAPPRAVMPCAIPSNQAIIARASRFRRSPTASPAALKPDA